MTKGGTVHFGAVGGAGEKFYALTSRIEGKDRKILGGEKNWEKWSHSR